MSGGRAANWASHSQLVTFRHCPQKWHYGSLQRLSKVDPDDVKVEMELGSWWHMLRAADAIERGRKLDSLKWVPEKLTCINDGPTLTVASVTELVDAVCDLAFRWWGEQTPEIKEIWEGRIGEGLPARLLTLNQRWYDQWGPEIEHEHPLAVELRWDRQLPSLPQPGGERVDPDTVMLGYVDEVYLDIRRNLVVVRDDKSSKGLSTQTTADDMMDSQLQLYAWGANPTVTAWGHGPIRAVAYDRIRTTKPKTPQLTLAGTLSKSITDFDLATYLEWVARSSR